MSSKRQLHLKKYLLGILIILFCTPCTLLANGNLPYPPNAYAPPPIVSTPTAFPMSAYFGITAGYSWLDDGNGFENVLKTGASHSTKKGRFGGGGFIGFRFNPYLAIQTGYLYFRRNEYSGTLGKADVNMQAINALLKVILPLGNTRRGYARVELFGEGGAAYVITNIKTSGPIFASSRDNHNIQPMAGAGVAFHINRLVSMTLSYEYIFGKNLINTSKATTGFKDSVPDGSLAAVSFIFSGPVDLP